MAQAVEGLTDRANRFLALLSEQPQQLPAPVIWAGLELVASVNALMLELHHESTSHLHKQKAELQRRAEPSSTEEALQPLTAARMEMTPHCR